METMCIINMCGRFGLFYNKKKWLSYSKDLSFFSNRAIELTVFVSRCWLNVLKSFSKTGLETMLKVSLTVGLEVGQSDRHHVKPHTIHLRLPPGTSVP